MHTKQNKPSGPVSEPREQREARVELAVEPGQPAGKTSN